MRRMSALVVSLLIISAAPTLAQSAGDKQTGLAAVYTDALDGHVTASGQLYDKAKLTAAHQTLPYGTKIKVTNPKNSRSVVSGSTIAVLFKLAVCSTFHQPRPLVWDSAPS